jgi:phosphoenolpyruvate carboxylase
MGILAASNETAGKVIGTVVDTLQTFHAASVLGQGSLGAYVISQAKASSDVLAVALLQQKPEVLVREQQDNRLTLQINREEVPVINNWLQSQGVLIYAIESKRKLEDYFLKLVNN